MSWTTSKELRAQLLRRWERGELLRLLVGGGEGFPLRLVLRTPTSSDLTEHFDAVRRWAAELAAMPHLRLEWSEVRHRVQGLQRLPRSAWVDTLDDACALLGKRRDAERLSQLVAQTRELMPELLPWLARRPLRALELAEPWPQLLAIVRWCVGHPRSGIYLRQVDAPGVHTKLIETHRAVLSELLDLALPPAAIDHEQVGVAHFAPRYGFREKPLRIRFRVLDPQLQLLPGTASYPDLTLDAESFATVTLPIERVFITENETNFLAFPPVPAAIVIFGGGYGWDALARAGWLTRCRIDYWGDIDTHGFAILDALRSHFQHAASLLMDRETLTAHRDHWGEEPEQLQRDLSRLTPHERALYDDLRHNRIRPHLRLEQERIAYAHLLRVLHTLAA